MARVLHQMYRYVELNPEGGVVYSFTFEKEFEQLGGDLDLLHRCIEQNVKKSTYTDEFGRTEVIEIIDYPLVIKEYRRRKYKR